MTPSEKRKRQQIIVICIVLVGLLYIGVRMAMSAGKEAKPVQPEVIVTTTLDSSQRGNNWVVLVKVDDRLVTIHTSQLIRKGDTVKLTRKYKFGNRRYGIYDWRIQLLERANE